MILRLDTELSEKDVNPIGDKQIFFDGNCLNIVSKQSVLLTLPNLWLRDNCLCDECRNVRNRGKIVHSKHCFLRSYAQYGRSN